MAHAKLLVLFLSSVACTRVVHRSAGYLRQGQAIAEHQEMAEGTLVEGSEWPAGIKEIYANYKKNKCPREGTKDKGSCQQNAFIAKECKLEKEGRQKVVKWCKNPKNKKACKGFNVKTHQHEIKRAQKMAQVFSQYLTKCVKIPAKGMDCCVGNAQGKCTGREAYKVATSYNGAFCFNSKVEFVAKDNTAKTLKDCAKVQKMKGGKCDALICKDPKKC